MNMETLFIQIDGHYAVVWMLNISLNIEKRVVHVGTSSGLSNIEFNENHPPSEC